jgi:uncharacterized protein YdaU (DUF1376 family)
VPSKKLPYLTFFTSDYVRDTRILSLEARAIWMDMLCLMHDGDKRGYLSRADVALTSDQVARFCGVSPAVAQKAIDEIIGAGIASRDDKGVIYSRRIVRDEKKRKTSAAFGRKGGNPKLMEWYKLPGFVYAIIRESDNAVKLGASVKPIERCNHRKGSLRGETCKVIKTWPVTNMGKAEATLHELLADKCVGGEWFRVNIEDIDGIGQHLTLKGLLNGDLNESEMARLEMEYGDGSSNGIDSSSSEGWGVGEGSESLATSFAEFWLAYPRKVAKSKAAQAWLKLSPNRELVAVILAAVEAQKRSEQWTKDNGQFIPHATTWLNQERWNDELPPASTVTPTPRGPTLNPFAAKIKQDQDERRRQQESGNEP